LSIRASGRGRARVIQEIETVEQGIKVELDVESGFYKILNDHITYWIAVEEDIVDSYARLLERSEGEVKSNLAQIVEGTKNHIRSLESIKQSLSTIVSDTQQFAKLLQNLQNS
jgi:Mg2+ and Co2+ transporter CorA